MYDAKPYLARLCRHCGTVDASRLWQCTVCGMAVCDRCGNVQHVHGEGKVIHNACLADGDHGFTMIRFVK